MGQNQMEALTVLLKKLVLLVYLVIQLLRIPPLTQITERVMSGLYYSFLFTLLCTKQSFSRFCYVCSLKVPKD